MPSLPQSSFIVPAIMKAWSRLSIWQGPAISENRAFWENRTPPSPSPTRTSELGLMLITSLLEGKHHVLPGRGRNAQAVFPPQERHVISSKDRRCHGKIGNGDDKRATAKPRPGADGIGAGAPRAEGHTSAPQALIR